MYALMHYQRTHGYHVTGVGGEFNIRVRACVHAWVHVCVCVCVLLHSAVHA